MCSRGLEVDPSLWGGEEEERTRGGDWKRGEEEIREVEKMRGGEDERRRGGGEERR